MRGVTVVAILLAFVMIPFAVAGERLDVWSADILRSAAGHSGLVMSMVVLLLVADVALPIPSSLVSTSGGLLLGFVGGFAASLMGMTAGAILAYALGRSTRGWARRLLDGNEGDLVEATFRLHGDWLLVASRPVPVLAESIPILAGLYRMPFVRFLWLTALANTGVSAVYATVGAFSADMNSLLLAFLGALLMPLGPLLWFRRTAGSIRAAANERSTVARVPDC